MPHFEVTLYALLTTNSILLLMVYYRILDLERYLNEPSMTMIQLSPHNNYIIRGNTAIKKT